MNPFLAYKVTPPTDKPSFYAIVNEADDGSIDEVWSNRDGTWKVDPLFTRADLIQPEQDFNEWDIIEIPIAELPGNAEKASAVKAAALAVLKEFDESKHPRDDKGRFIEVYRGIWGPDMPHEAQGGHETWSADRAIAEAYAQNPNDPILLDEMGGVINPRLITAELRSMKTFRLTETQERIDDVAERLRLDKSEISKLIDDIDQFNEKSNPRFEAWQYGDSKVFRSLLRDRGYDLLESKGAFVADNKTTHPIEYRVIDPAILTRTKIEELERQKMMQHARSLRESALAALNR
jgi:hypothetical protein